MLLAGCAAPAPTTTEAALTDLAPGACFDLGDDDATAFVHVDCTVAHRFEAIAVVPIDADAIPDCAEAFRERAGAVDAARGVASRSFVPTSASWERGDRDILCVAEGVEQTEGASS